MRVISPSTVALGMIRQGGIWRQFEISGLDGFRGLTFQRVIWLQPPSDELIIAANRSLAVKRGRQICIYPEHEMDD